MRLRLHDEDIPNTQTWSGWYLGGHFYVYYYSSKMKIAVKREVTNYADEEMKTYFQTLDLLHESIWALNFNLIYKDGYFDIDIDSIR